MTITQIPTDNGTVELDLLRKAGKVIGLVITKDAQTFTIHYDALPVPKNPEDRVGVQEQLQVALDAALGPSVKVFVQSLTPPIVRVR